MEKYNWIVITGSNDWKNGMEVYYSKHKTPRPVQTKHMELLLDSTQVATLDHNSSKRIRSHTKDLLLKLIELIIPHDLNEYRVIDLTSEDLCKKCGEIEKSDYLFSQDIRTLEDIQDGITKEQGVCRSCFQREWEEYRKIALNTNSSLYEELSKIDTLHGYKFEKYIATLLKALGLDYAEVNTERPDWGIDVVATWGDKKIGIQCKNEKNKQSVWAVQQAFSGAAYFDCDYAVVINTNEFTPNAIKMANKINVHVIDKAALTKIIKGTIENQNKENLLRMITGD